MNSYIAEDVCITDDYFLGRHKYFLSSESRGKYFKLTQEQYEFFYGLIPFLKTTDDRGKIEVFLEKNTTGLYVLEQVDEFLKKNNILYKAYQERANSIEAEFSSNKLAEVPLRDFQIKYDKLLRAGWWIMLFLSVASITTMALIRVFSKANMVSVEVRNSNSFFEYGGPISWLIILFGAIMCIVGHEMGHLLSANFFGIEYKSITFALRWGLQPMYYVRYHNFYHHKSMHKLVTILSGIWMNLFMISIYYIAGVFIPMRGFEYLILINALGMLKNILPKGTSDGYHAFCTILGIEGIRWKMLGRISEILNHPSKFREILNTQETRFLFGYFCVSYGVSLFGCYKIFMNTWNIFDGISNEQIRIIAKTIAAASIVSLVIVNVLKLTTNVKRMNVNA